MTDKTTAATEPKKGRHAIKKPIPELIKSVSSRIRYRLTAMGQRFFSNDNIASAIEPGELDQLIDEVAEKMQGVLDSLVIDTENDHNSHETARRVAKMFIREAFSGRYTPEPSITEFPNVTNLDQLYIVGPITFRSYCAHHLVPITGTAYIGVLPTDNVIGLSKFSRAIAHLAERPQIQEEFTQQVADKLEELVKPEGLAVVIRAHHMCCSHRGVKDKDQEMVTSVCRGSMLKDPSLKSEFFTLLAMSSK